jgi:hypothetical protein
MREGVERICDDLIDDFIERARPADYSCSLPCPPSSP